MRRLLAIGAIFAALGQWSQAQASPALLKQHCAECHNADKAKGKFKLADLGTAPNAANFQRWLDASELVGAQEMPPEDGGNLTAAQRKQLVALVAIRHMHGEGPVHIRGSGQVQPCLDEHPVGV